MANKTYTVTVASGDLYGGGTGNVYYLDGTREFDVIWEPGLTYRFDQSDSSNDNHPLLFSTTQSKAQIISTGVTYYLDGVSNETDYMNSTTFNAATTRYVEITSSSASSFYYLCWYHGIGMGGLMSRATGITYDVTVASGSLYGGGTGNVFYLDGVRNATGPGTVSWVAGSVIRFDQTASTNDGHPLIFSTNTSTSGIISANVSYFLDGASTQSDYINTTTFNNATDRYVEITPSSFTDFYYLCYVHGIGMGGIMDMVVNSWGAHSWNQGAWNQNQDLTVFVSNPNDSLWGRDTWGTYFWGGGQNMDMSLNNDGITTTTQIFQGWGSDTWGTETWGQSGNLHQVTGLAMTMAEGSGGISINGDSSLTLSGNPLTVSAPSIVEAFASFTAFPSGIPMVAQLNFNPAFAEPNSLPMTAALGTAVGEPVTIAEITSAIPGYWGYKSTWGTLAWGNGSTELLTMAMSENFSGVDPAPDASLTGQQMSMSLAQPGQNNFDITGDANTGAGDTTMAWGDATWGNSRWNNGQFIADPDYGQTMTMVLGVETIDLNTPVDVTGFGMSLASSLTPIIIPECNVDVTGNALTFSLGTATNVLIWNEVNTGTAPVDPPGWQEVSTNAA